MKALWLVSVSSLVLVLAGCGDKEGCQGIEEGQRFSVEIVDSTAVPDGYLSPGEEPLPSCGQGFDLRAGDSFTVAVDSVTLVEEDDVCKVADGHVEEAAVGDSIELTRKKAPIAPDEAPGLEAAQAGSVAGCPGFWTMLFATRGVITPSSIIVRVFSPKRGDSSCASVPVGGVLPRCQDAFTVSTKEL